MAGNKETPRQKMIGMMYLVLTCLLALNVSRDILKGFVTVNESLEKTNNSMQQSNELMLNAFEKAANENQSAKGYYIKAIEGRKLTGEMIKYIESMKKKLIEITEKIDWKTADTMRLRFVEKMDDYDIPTYQLIGSDETNLTTKSFSASELRHKLNDLHSKLIIMLDGMEKVKETRLLPEDYKLLKSKIDLIKPVDPNEMEDDVKLTWEVQNFYHLPLAAVVTNLSKIESDVKNLETEIINQFAAASGKLVVKINQFAAKVVAPSKYIRSGENYIADIILAGSSSDFKDENMQILMGAKYDPVTNTLIDEGAKIVLEGGMGKYEVKTSGQGEQTVSGVIKFKDQLGEMKYYPFEDKFTVAPPVSAVSADKMNVFYAGLKNDITISASGVAPKNLVVKLNGNNAPLKVNGNGKFSIEPRTTGTCEIAVYSREENGQLKAQGPPSKFRVKPLPTPFVKINSKYVTGTLEMKKLDLVFLGAIGADIPGFDFDAKFKIKSFTLYAAKGDLLSEIKCFGPNLSEPAKEAIKKVRPGGRVFLENIISVGPDGVERPLGNVIIKVKS